jgi:hypothetical protein
MDGRLKGKLSRDCASRAARRPGPSPDGKTWSNKAGLRVPRRDDSQVTRHALRLSG